MKEITLEDLPPEIRKTFLNQQVDIILDIIEKAGLLLEFRAFTESEEIFNIKSFDELCTEFAKKYPEKLHVISNSDRYNKIFLCT